MCIIHIEENNSSQRCNVEKTREEQKSCTATTTTHCYVHVHYIVFYIHKKTNLKILSRYITWLKAVENFKLSNNACLKRKCDMAA